MRREQGDAIDGPRWGGADPQASDNEQDCDVQDLVPDEDGSLPSAHCELSLLEKVDEHVQRDEQYQEEVQANRLQRFRKKSQDGCIGEQKVGDTMLEEGASAAVLLAGHHSVGLQCEVTEDVGDNQGEEERERFLRVCVRF